MVAEGGGWAAILPGRLPVHGDGETLTEAVDDPVLALREYAEDWNARLYRAPNHRVHRTVVELVELSDDDQLCVTEEQFWAWVGGRRPPGRAAEEDEPPSNALPAQLVFQLVTEVGVPEEQVAQMSLEQAVVTMTEHWTRPRR